MAYVELPAEVRQRIERIVKRYCSLRGLHYSEEEIFEKVVRMNNVVERSFNELLESKCGSADSD